MSLGIREGDRAIDRGNKGRELEGGGDSGEMISDSFRPALSKVEGICNLEFKIIRMDKLKNFAANISPGKED